MRKQIEASKKSKEKVIKIQIEHKLLDRRSKTKIAGITLIALVITIIVLLILAGVSIATLTGENGIIKNAGTAKEKSEIASIIESAQTDIVGIQTENKENNITKEELKAVLEKYFSDVPEKLPNDLSDLELTAKDEYGGHKIKVSDIYKGSLKQTLAKNVLKADSTATEAQDKSSYVKYNNLDCRVLYNDDIHGLQIITSNSVEDIELGYKDSEVTALDFSYGEGENENATLDDNFKKAAASYNNVVDNMNKRAKKYMDDKGIATDARSFGSKATLVNGVFQGDDSEMHSQTSPAYLITYGWNNKFKKSNNDTGEDMNQTAKLGIAISKAVWVPSRQIEFNNVSQGYFAIRITNNAGAIIVGYIRSNGTTSVNTNLSAYGFRPVFLLSSNAVVSDGDGSREFPYVIE